MTENVIQIDGKDYNPETFSAEQNYIVAQIKSLQTKSNQTKFELDQIQAALNVFTNKLIESLPKEEK
tara:strand:+ start:1100 stop:1300 length:201 start_codon:yes stop_codon:yes gene_type:complete